MTENYQKIVCQCKTEFLTVRSCNRAFKLGKTGVPFQLFNYALFQHTSTETWQNLFYFSHLTRGLFAQTSFLLSHNDQLHWSAEKKQHFHFPHP